LIGRVGKRRPRCSRICTTSVPPCPPAETSDTWARRSGRPCASRRPGPPLPTLRDDGEAQIV
jgi:hypothetical protein